MSYIVVDDKKSNLRNEMHDRMSAHRNVATDNTEYERGYREGYEHGFRDHERDMTEHGESRSTRYGK